LGKIWGAVGLLTVSLFMMLGFMRVAADGIAAAEIIAFALVVLLPLGFGIKLLRDHFGRDKRVEANKSNMRDRTLSAEVLKLAGTHGGKLTIVEVVTALAITSDEAKRILDNLALESHADFQVTDSGVVVYDFKEIRRMDDKSTARGILE
jgi:hypothetical protein